MRPQLVMFLGLLFAAGTLISLTFGGSWIGSDELEVANSLAVFRDITIANYWSVSAPNPDFFFTGLKSMMMLDFAFFTGSLQILQWILLLVIISGVLWGIFSLTISAIQGVISRIV